MADLLLKGSLSLNGNLSLNTSAGGKVKANGVEVLVQGERGVGTAHGIAPAPVPIPPPPAVPLEPGVQVWIFRSFNVTVKANGKAIVAQGLCAQGSPSPGMATWPGMVQPSSVNPTIKVNGIPANVVGDQGLILPTGAPVPFTASGQG